MHEERGLVGEPGEGRVAQESAPGLAAEGTPDQEVAVAVHQMTADPGCGNRGERGLDLGVGRALVVVADPGVEDVAE